MPEDRSIGPPHVTDILRDAGLIDIEWFRAFDLDRGSALHKATELLDLNDLDWSSVDPAILGRLRSYQKFKDEVRPEILAIEEKVVNVTYHYQGKLDRRARIKGRECIIDLKGPSEAAWNGVQLAAYAACFPRPLGRYNLYLSDERYRLVERKERMDWEVFKAAITIAAWRQKHDR